ncbi:RDD family protein [Dokdonella sp.]|uniref:RDD family protein n=1 Tax=Dokdonella sp. TaxID=2291710 RepID=UPI003528E3E4
MENTKRALVLTGELLPGFDAEKVWPAVASYFRIDEARLKSDVLARVPMTVKESSDLADLTQRQTRLTELGALSEVHALDGGSHFVLVDNVPRGPLPRSYIEKRLRRGGWPASVKVAPVGSTDWRTFDPGPEVSAPPPALNGNAANEVDPEDTVAAKIARVADSIASKKDPLLPLPAGPAIHAGFWRRSAAYLIDGLIIAIPAMILMIIPLLGVIVYFVGYWLYFALQESSAVQATLGKRAMGLIVTDGKGQRLGFGQATGRFFAAAISHITFYIGYMLAGWTTRKQALHDLIADTCVVFNTVKPGQALPTVRPPMPWYGWVVNGLLLALFPLAILAAIAVPAYQDYVVRARISEAFIEVSPAKIEVSQAVIASEPCPQGLRNSSSPLVDSIRIAGTAPDCVITLTFASGPDVPDAARDESIEWAYIGDNDWSCVSSVESRYLPAACR